MKIEDYKGFEITLDTQTGKFVGDGATSRMAKEFESTSLPTLRKKINTFIKENQSFGAFKVRPKNDNWDITRLKKTTLVKGVTSNKRLTVEKPDGRTGTIGRYDINGYVLYNEEHNEIIDQAIKLKEDADKKHKIATDKIKDLLATLEEKPLAEFLKESGIEVDINERGW